MEVSAFDRAGPAFGSAPPSLGAPAVPTPDRDFFAVLPFGIGLLVASLALTAVAIWWLRRRPQDQTRLTVKARRVWRAATAVAAGLTLILGLAALVNWYVGWLPNFEAVRIRLGLDDPSQRRPELPTAAPALDQLGARPLAADDARLARAQPGGGAGPVKQGAASSYELPAPDYLNLATKTVWVYTPPGYDPSGQVAYPVVYLFHGSPGSGADWIAAGAPQVLDQMIVAGELAPVIAVAPDLGARGAADSGCLNSTKPGGSQVETFLYEVVRPWVVNHFPVSSERSASAVAGMSMGGYCAVDQGIRHSDVFSTVLAIMPYGGPGEAGEAMKSSPAEIDAVTPLKYLATASKLPADPIAVWFAVPGAEETKQVGNETAAMAAALRERGQSTTVYVAPGQDHTWKMAIAAFPLGLRYWQEQLAAIP
ncbi:MAG: esterase family protein [Bifidobacteriaceae bacterium]|nr:esterase family protein [Bifidobacteriaceae bacterium]